MTGVSLAATFSIALYYGVAAGLSGSAWYITLAGYYGILVILRTAIIWSVRRAMRAEEDDLRQRMRGARTFLASGALLVLLTLALSGVIVLTVLRGKAIHYAGLMIYVAALYAFVKIVLALYHAIKDRGSGNFAVRSLQNINIADALVSVFALQTAMLQTFSNGGAQLNAPLFNAITGGTIGIVLLTLGSYMIVRGVHLIWDLQAEKRDAPRDGT